MKLDLDPNPHPNPNPHPHPHPPNVSRCCANFSFPSCVEFLRHTFTWGPLPFTKWISTSREKRPLWGILFAMRLPLVILPLFCVFGIKSLNTSLYSLLLLKACYKQDQRTDGFFWRSVFPYMATSVYSLSVSEFMCPFLSAKQNWRVPTAQSSFNTA